MADRRFIAVAVGALAYACAPSAFNEVPQTGGLPGTASAASSATVSSTDGGNAPSESAYEYVARARSGKVSIAIAESRGPERARAIQGTERALDIFVRCLGSIAADGRVIAPGAARVVLKLSEHGDVLGERVVAGKDSSYIVVRCLLPALKLQTYGASKLPNDSQSLGIALEAIWE